MHGLSQSDQFDDFVEKEKQNEMTKFAEVEKLDSVKLKEMITNIEHGLSVDNLKSDDLAKLTTEKMTFRTRRTILPRIAEKLKSFAETFIDGFH